MGFVVDFPDAFPAQEFQKFIHISIELFLLKQVMKGEGTAFFITRNASRTTWRLSGWVRTS